MTIIELDDDTITYKKNITNRVSKSEFLFTLLILFIIFIISICFSILQYFEWEPLEVLAKFKRIKKNINSWTSITKEKTAIEANKGKLLYLSKKNVANMQCLDYGNYYIPGRISKDSYLPEFIKRGNSGPWVIQKANKIDESARQFCYYVLNKYSSNTITCGIQMYEELGYSGYFLNDSPCENAISIFLNLNE